jgi:hypothetical protein
MAANNPIGSAAAATAAICQCASAPFFDSDRGLSLWSDADDDTKRTTDNDDFDDISDTKCIPNLKNLQNLPNLLGCSSCGFYDQRESFRAEVAVFRSFPNNDGIDLSTCSL